MNEDINAKLDALKTEVHEVNIAINKMRKYFLWTLIISVAVVVLPLIGLVAVLPQFLSSYTSGLTP